MGHQSKKQSFADKYRGGKGVVDKKPPKANEAASKKETKKILQKKIR